VIAVGTVRGKTHSRMLRKLAVVATAAVALSVTMTDAQAIPVQWTVASGGNDHYYESIGFTGTWTSARADALSRSYLGLPGYLVTLASPAEQAFLLSIGTFSSGWIGGTDQASEGVWVWADGPEAGLQFWSGGPCFMCPGTLPPFFYAPWHGGDPSGGATENWAYLQLGGWNDFPAQTTATYFIEYSALPPSPVPEPTTLCLMSAGLVGLLRPRARRTRAPRRVRWRGSWRKESRPGAA